jgi:hypothetical protein
LGYRNEIYRAALTAGCRGGGSPARSRDVPLGSCCALAPLAEWKARGWRAFDGLDAAEQSATRVDPKDSSIHGLSYCLQSCLEGEGEKILIRIDSWRYDSLGETTDLPIMELVFDAAGFSVPIRALDSLKIMARKIHLTERLASRAVNAAWFFINQINAKQVPDFERILTLHRIHPDINRIEDENGNGAGLGKTALARLDQMRSAHRLNRDRDRPGRHGE